MSLFEQLATFLQNAFSRRAKTQLARHWNISPVLLALSFALLGDGATAAAQVSHYISPTGSSDANPGTQASPWRTFAHAVAFLNPGDTLFLLNGTYQPATGTGFVNINCGSNAKNGTASAPITIRALNERQAFIKGDGSAEPFRISNCNYWRIIGLHIEDGDFTGESGGIGNPGVGGNVIEVTRGSHYYFGRNILARSNRYKNAHLFIGVGITSSLIEENELYYLYRHGIVLFNGANGNDVRRNYANARGYFNGPSGDYCGNCLDTAGFMNYGGQNNIFENNISEGVPIGHNHEPVTGGPIARDDSWFGEISLNDNSCFRSSVHTANDNSVNISWKNSVCITPTNNGLWSRSSTNTTFDHISVFGKSSTSGGITCDKDASGGSLPFTCSGHSVAVSGISRGSAFLLAGGATGKIDYLNSSGNAAHGAPISHLIAVNPGPCFLWVPVASPLHGAGVGGTDIGANVVFRYEGGTLTSEPLWDSTTGAPLFKGATVAGLNDVPGSSLFDIANRLNINQNGCSLPTGANQASAPAAPTGLTATVQ